MAAMDGALATTDVEDRPVDLTEIGPLVVRSLDLDDCPAMQRLLGRCGTLRGATSVETIIRSLDWRPATASTVTLGTIDLRGEHLVGLGGIVGDPRIEGAARFGLVVDPAVRGHGVGRALLAELLRAAARVGYRSVRARTGDGNGAMQALARRAGFTLQRTVGDEPVLLTRPLTA